MYGYNTLKKIHACLRDSVTVHIKSVQDRQEHSSVFKSMPILPCFPANYQK